MVLAITPEGLAADATSSAPELFTGLGPVAPDPEQSFSVAEGWHKHAVVYHIWIAGLTDPVNGVVSILLTFGIKE